ncbi:MAG TPA: GTP 3',8-cyclase MoaA [Acidobacteriota bacterium]|nr:GTP 3',8-cyclase MoaA [Acidobacteriota bacterium]
MLQDSFGRTIEDLRVSVTDRCNFKCVYCKSARSLAYQERDQILSFEEIERLAGIFTAMGIRKLRITGGEPMVRRELEKLIERLAVLPGLSDLALTTNGFNLYQKAALLKEKGLDRVTISLDSLQPERFRRITRSDDFDKVMKSIEAAKEEGLDPVKINCVVVREFNDDEIVDFAEMARRLEITVRFIEFMPLDEDEGWTRRQVFSGAEILEILESRYELRERPLKHPSQTSRNYDFADSGGRIGLIMPVSRPFCGACSRIRLTADGKIRTCLFSHVEHDIKSLMRSGAGDAELRSFILDTVAKKEARHHINEPHFVPPSRSMSYIGG